MLRVFTQLLAQIRTLPFVETYPLSSDLFFWFLVDEPLFSFLSFFFFYLSRTRQVNLNSERTAKQTFTYMTNAADGCALFKFEEALVQIWSRHFSIIHSVKSVCFHVAGAITFYLPSCRRQPGGASANRRTIILYLTFLWRQFCPEACRVTCSDCGLCIDLIQ